MVKKTCAWVMSLLMMLNVLLPLQTAVALANDEEASPQALAAEPQPTEEQYVIVDDVVTDSTKPHYFTYTKDTDKDGLKGWASDKKDAIQGDDNAKTQHWVWNNDHSEAAKHTYIFTFNGTGVELVGVKNDAANVFQLDKEKPVETPINGGQNQPVTLYKRTGLQFGTHTISVTLPENSGTGLQVCYAKVYGAKADTTPPEPEQPKPEEPEVPQPTEPERGEPLTIPHNKVEGASNKFTYSGNDTWESSDLHAWSKIGEKDKVWYEVEFVGNAIHVYAGKNRPMGKVEYFIDGKSVGVFSLYNDGNINETLIAKFTGLTEDKHTFRAVATGERDTNSSDSKIDAAKVIVYHEPYVVTAVSPKEEKLALTNGQTKQLELNLTPDYASFADLTFETENQAIATVTQDGAVKGVSVGETNIKVLPKGKTEPLATIPVSVQVAEASLGGSIVDVDTQYTQERYDEILSLDKKSEALFAWKNDAAISEIALVSKNCELKNVTVTPLDLKGKNGETIPASQVQTTFIKSTTAYAGGYPGYGGGNKKNDLPPQGNRKESNDVLYQSTPIDIPYNQVQPVWVKINVPKNAKAGEYQTTIKVEAEGLKQPLEFQYTLTVQDAALKDAVEFKDSFDIELWQYPYSIAEYYGVEPFSPEHLEILKPHMELYKSIGGHAITATIVEDAWDGQTYSKNPDIHYPSMIKWVMKDGKMTYDYSHFDKWVEFNKGLGIGDKIVLYSIAPWHNSFTYWENNQLVKKNFKPGTEEYNAMWTDFLQNLIAHLTQKGWFDQCYIGIDERGFNEKAFDLIESVTNEQGECLKTAGAINKFEEHYNLAMRITDINVGDNCVVNGNEAKFDRFLEERKEKGFRTTLYTCTEHKPSNFSLSAPVESYWTVVNAGKKTDGLLRWAYDAWVQDPLRDTTHNAFEPGDCFMVFPDEPKAQNPATKSSVRLERMAQGVRDVNKLRQMVEKYPDMQADVDRLYEQIHTQAKVVSQGQLLSKEEVQALSAEMKAFRDGINNLTKKYLDPDAHKGYEYNRVILKDITGITADSETNPPKGTDGPAAYAFDQNKDTIWHTNYDSQKKPLPHTISWKVGEAKSIGKIEYIARSNGVNGNWKKFVVEGKNGNGEWFPLAEVNNPAASSKTVIFEPKTVTELRIRIDESAGNEVNMFATAAEINTYEADFVPVINLKRQELRNRYADSRELELDSFTKQSVSALKNAQKLVEQTLKNKTATNEEIAAAAQTLADAVSGLRVEPSKLAEGAPKGGVSHNNPFPNAGDKGCITDNIRIPGIITLKNGWLAASADARWNHHGDHGNIDGLFSISKDGGKTWNYFFPQFFNDSTNQFHQLAANLMDPVLIQGEDGVIYLLIDAFPAGSALHGQATYHPAKASGYVEIEGQKRLAIYTNIKNQTNNNYQYYVGDFDTNAKANGKDLAPIIARNDKQKEAKYYIDRWFNLYDKDKQIMACKQLGSDKYVQQNLFYLNADLHVRTATYLWLITSKDNGEHWSAPQLLNEQIYYEDASFLGVGPGAGLSFVDANNQNVIIMPTYANPTGGERSNFVYTWDGGTTWEMAPAAPASTSESCMVQIDETTVRKFLRSGATQVQYVDYTWNPETHTFTIGELVQVGGTSKTANNQVSAVRYPKTVDGKPVILVSTATGGNRGRGHIYTFTVEADKTLKLLNDYQVSHNDYDYHYSSLTVKPNGDIALFYENQFGGAGSGAGGSSHHNYLNLSKEDLGLKGTMQENAYTFNLSLYQPMDGSLAPIPSQEALDSLDSSIIHAELRDGTVFYTGLKEGTQTLKYTKNGKDIVVTLKVKEDSSIQHEKVVLEIGEEKTFTTNGEISYQSNPSLVKTTVEPILKQTVVGQTGTDKGYTGEKEPLESALFTFEKQGEKYTIKNGSIYFALVGNTAGLPFATEQQSIIVEKSADGFTFRGDDKTWLWFWKEKDDHRFDRNSSHQKGNCDFDIFRVAADGEATEEIAGFVKLKELNEIQSGEKYLIAAKASDGKYYVMRPSDSSNKYQHVLRVIGQESTTVGYTLKMVAEKAGEGVVVAGHTAFHITVKAPKPVIHTVTIEGKSVQIEHGKALGDALPKEAEKEGYLFKGWQDEQGNPVTQETIVERDMVITAVFEKQEPSKPETPDSKPNPPSNPQTPSGNQPSPSGQPQAPSQNQPPRTGDEGVLAWILLIMACSGGAVMIHCLRKKERE